jgi:hypothetical protein
MTYFAVIKIASFYLPGLNPHTIFGGVVNSILMEFVYLGDSILVI